MFTSPTDDLPEVLAARAAVKAAQGPAHAQPDDNSLWAALEAAEEALGDVLQRVRPANPCNCESVHHYTVEDVPDHPEYPRDGHPFMAVPAGSRRAWGVGEVCDDCANTHMAPYLQPAEQAPAADLCLGCGLLPPEHAPGCPVVEARRSDIPDPGATSRRPRKD